MCLLGFVPCHNGREANLIKTREEGQEREYERGNDPLPARDGIEEALFLEYRCCLAWTRRNIGARRLATNLLHWNHSLLVVHGLGRFESSWSNRSNVASPDRVSKRVGTGDRGGSLGAYRGGRHGAIYAQRSFKCLDRLWA